MRVIAAGIVGVVMIAAAAAGPGAAQPAPGADSSSGIVVPGYAIGRWNLDMTVAEIFWQRSETVRTQDLRSSSPGIQFRANVLAWMWESPSLVALFFPLTNSVTTAVASADRGYATVERIGVGTGESQVIAAYGTPSAIVEIPNRPRTFVYDARGVAFEFPPVPGTGRYGPVSRTYVFRPGQAAAIWRTP